MGAIKYSLYMPVYKAHPVLQTAISSGLEAMGDRDDIEFILIDTSKGYAQKMQDESLIVDVGSLEMQDVRVRYEVYDMEMDAINQWGVGVWESRGKYFCPLQQNSLCHPKRFDYCDELFDMGYDIVGAENHVVFDLTKKITYKDHPDDAYGDHNNIRFPIYHHSNSAIPLDWLRINNYEGGIKMGLFSKNIIVAQPIWVQASTDKLIFGMFDEINKDAWKLCWDIEDNVNPSEFNRIDIDHNKLVKDLE